MSGVNEVNMAKWIVALRSGKYAQTRSRLRAVSGEMCCMGVACEVSNLGRWVPATTASRGMAYSLGGRLDSTAVLPIPVRDWLGVVGCNPTVVNDLACGDVNDAEEWNFGQIADALESHYLPGKKAEQILSKVRGTVA